MSSLLYRCEYMYTTMNHNCACQVLFLSGEEKRTLVVHEYTSIWVVAKRWRSLV